MSDSKNHTLIQKYDERALYAQVERLVSLHHAHLATARIALVWRYGLKEDKDGKLVLGKCKKASDYDKAFVEYDFVILLNAEAWKELDSKQQEALLDHELCHAAGEKDDDGETVWRIRKHDIEEFRQIVERHGCYKADLEAFVKTAVANGGPSLFDAPRVVDPVTGEEVSDNPGLDSKFGGTMQEAAQKLKPKRKKAAK